MPLRVLVLVGLAAAVAAIVFAFVRLGETGSGPPPLREPDPASIAGPRASRPGGTAHPGRGSRDPAVEGPGPPGADGSGGEGRGGGVSSPDRPGAPTDPETPAPSDTPAAARPEESALVRGFLRSLPGHSESTMCTDFGVAGPRVWISVTAAPASCNVCEVVYVGVRVVVEEGRTEPWDPGVAPRVWLETNGVGGERGESRRTVPEEIPADSWDLEPLPASPELPAGRGEHAYAADRLVGAVRCITGDRQVVHFRLTETGIPVAIRACMSLEWSKPLERNRIARSAGTFLKVCDPEEREAEPLRAIRASGLLPFVGMASPADPPAPEDVAGFQGLAGACGGTPWGDEFLLGMYQVHRLAGEAGKALACLRELRAGPWPAPIRAFAFVEESRHLCREGRWDELRTTMESARSIDWGLFPAWRGEMDRLRSSLR